MKYLPLVAALLSAAAAGATAKGQIAFVMGAEQQSRQVCVLDLATGTVTPVGPGRGDGAPRWSPDGAWLAFTTMTEEGTAVYLVRAAGSEGRTLTHGYRWNHDVRWSTDGKRLAYSASQEMDLARVVVVHDIAEGTETVWGGGRPGLLRPVWMASLDLMRALDPNEEFSLPGLDVARFRDEGMNDGVLITPGVTGAPGALSLDLYLVTRSETAPILPFVLPEDAVYEEWAVEPDPRAQAFVFESNDGGDREIFLLNRRGVQDISNHRAADWNPVWSTGGDYVAFESFRGGRRGIYRVYPGTARVVPVVASAEHDYWAPAWAPDDRWLAFISNRDGSPDLYVCAISGSGVRRPTQTPGPKFAPAWRPGQED